MADFWPVLTNQPESRDYEIRLLGANGANPTEQLGADVTVTRTGEGAYLITWAKDPGVFKGWSISFGAATPADLKGYTAVRDTYSSSTLAFVVYDSTFTAADLIADQYADIVVRFTTTGLRT